MDDNSILIWIVSSLFGHGIIWLSFSRQIGSAIRKRDGSIGTVIESPVFLSISLVLFVVFWIFGKELTDSLPYQRMLAYLILAVSVLCGIRGVAKYKPEKDFDDESHR